jgi:hypothetical protein
MSTETETEIIPAGADALAVAQAAGAPMDIAVTGTVEAALRYLDAAAKFGRASSAMAVMAGFEIGALKKVGGWTQGGRRGKTRIDAVFAQHERFEDFCTSELHISVDTAQRYVALAEAAKPRLRKLGGFGAMIQELLVTPVSKLLPAQQEILSTAVHKLTDGRTQMELFQEWGVSKLGPKPGTGGALGGAGAPRREPTEAEIKDLSVRQWREVMGLATSAEDSFVHLPEEYQLSLQLHLESILEALKWWRSLRPSQRGPATRQEVKTRLKVHVA